MRELRIDLFSDTKTRPDAAMRAAMAAASVGDEQQDEDPTVAELNDRVARLLGKSAALFLPSGTMANVISSMIHCRRGDEILAEASSHLLHFETGGAAGLAGATVTPVPGVRGIFDAGTVVAAQRAPRRNAPRPRLVWIEQTTNLGGGAVWPLETLRQVRDVARDRGLAVHIDGARLMNAAVAAGVEASAYGAVCDSLWIDFTKGLGAPFGAVLAGDAEFIDGSRRLKHMLGGAMRQAGIMAAGCLHALDHGIARLDQDHRNARRLAEGLGACRGLSILGPVETNIVIADVSDTGKSASHIADALQSKGIRIGVFGPSLLRMITHKDVDEAAVTEAAQAIRQVVEARQA